eukprot:7975633-Alexandrium_andersonii.AAC.1
MKGTRSWTAKPHETWVMKLAMRGPGTRSAHRPVQGRAGGEVLGNEDAETWVMEQTAHGPARSWDMERVRTRATSCTDKV